MVAVEKKECCCPLGVECQKLGKSWNVLSDYFEIS
jgi:hypothetical protein